MVTASNSYKIHKIFAIFFFMSVNFVLQIHQSSPYYRLCMYVNLHKLKKSNHVNLMEKSCPSMCTTCSSSRNLTFFARNLVNFNGYFSSIKIIRGNRVEPENYFFPPHRTQTPPIFLFPITLFVSAVLIGSVTQESGNKQGKSV